MYYRCRGISVPKGRLGGSLALPSFPRRRESRDTRTYLPSSVDSRLRGNDESDKNESFEYKQRRVQEPGIREPQQGTLSSRVIISVGNIDSDS
jgi:hypothetical protein